MNSCDTLSANERADIQGFITSGFGHLPYSAYLLVEILEAAPARAWLRETLPLVTTASSWRVRPDAPKLKPRRTLNLAFTHTGLRALGMSEHALDSFPPEFLENAGSPERSRILGDTGDSAPTRWELGGTDTPPIHAMLILHAVNPDELESACDAQRALLTKAGPGVIEHERLAQHGERPEHGKEPFGFLDGIGQPQIRGISGKGVATGEFVLGHPNEYGFFPTGPVVPPSDDPAGILPASANPNHREPGYRDFGANGTFVVYRKLRQDVAGFWRFLQSESARLKGSPDPGFMVWMASKMVGRWPNGAPLVLSPDRSDEKLAGHDDFFYAQDPSGLACPIGSHIRRTNPRDHLRPAGRSESLRMTARHRLLRRGSSYGPPLFDLRLLDRTEDAESLRGILDLEDDGRDRGVHFLCVNASVKSQFEFVEQAWINNPRANGLVDEPDPVSGNSEHAGEKPGMLRIPGCPAGIRTSPLPRFVTVRGGTYLFMPGLTALRFLSDSGVASK